MDRTPLNALAGEQLAKARHATRPRAPTVYGGRGHDLRQTLIALAAGRPLGEHESPVRRRSRCCAAPCACSPARSRGTAPRATTS